MYVVFICILVHYFVIFKVCVETHFQVSTEMFTMMHSCFVDAFIHQQKLITVAAPAKLPIQQLSSFQ